jgi:hypothetical protein
MGDQQKRMQDAMRQNMEAQRKAQEQQRNQMAGMAKAAMGGRGPGGPPGAGRGGAPSNVDLSAADFTRPTGAVRAFLNALKAKDLDRLNESTALRASREAGSAKNRELFAKISDLTLSDSELDELAKKLEGYNVAGENPMRTTGRIDVVLQKPGEGGTYYRRRVTARREHKGWGVLDISAETEFKPPGMRFPARTGKRRS